MYSVADLLPTLIFQSVFFALYIVGVVRSRGPARILLAAWVVVSAITFVLNFFVVPMLFNSMGAVSTSVLLSLVNAVGSILLGVALIIGRPGYRGEAVQPTGGGFMAQPPHPMANPGAQPYYNPQTGSVPPQEGPQQGGSPWQQ